MRSFARLLTAFAASAVLLAFQQSASAHTIAIGTASAGPGLITIWMGSYHGSGALNEGSITLGGATKSFVTDADRQRVNQTAPPDGMVYGTDVFYADTQSFEAGSTPSYTSSTIPSNASVVQIWQGMTFSTVGLTPGTHTYTLSNMTSDNWQDWNTGTINWTGDIFIAATSLVPEPASLALLGLGLAGLGWRASGRTRRKV